MSTVPLTARPLNADERAVVLTERESDLQRAQARLTPIGLALTVIRDQYGNAFRWEFRRGEALVWTREGGTARNAVDDFFRFGPETRPETRTPAVNALYVAAGLYTPPVRPYADVA